MTAVASNSVSDITQLLDGSEVGMGGAEAAGESLYYLGVAVADEGFYEVGFEVALQTDLVPVFLVPVPGWLYLTVVVAQINSIVGIAFHHKVIGPDKSDTPEDLAVDTKQQTIFSKCHVFTRHRQGQTIFPYLFYIHHSANLLIYPYLQVKAQHIRYATLCAWILFLPISPQDHADQSV